MSRRDPAVPTADKAAPVRMCVICRGRFAKADLTRFVVAAETDQASAAKGGRLMPDPRAVLPGRGYYLCAASACAEKFLKYSGRLKNRKGGQGE